MSNKPIVFRKEVNEGDITHVREIVESTGCFFPHEVAIALELVEEYLSKKEKSEYRFLFGDEAGKPIAYGCYGEIGCSVGSFDLYWIVVHNSHRRKGIGHVLLKKIEEHILSLNGRLVYAETSSRSVYDTSRIFYQQNGYHLEATLKDFYNDGDDKLIFVKRLK